MSLGQVQPDRTNGYNQQYWAAVQADLNAQQKGMHFPGRPPEGKPIPQPSKGVSPSAIKAKPDLPFAGKKTKTQ
jgi:hypothetical protein